eukprot:653768-Pyramimonas_sp.AAC.1
MDEQEEQKEKQEEERSMRRSRRRGGEGRGGGGGPATILCAAFRKLSRLELAEPPRREPLGDDAGCQKATGTAPRGAGREEEEGGNIGNV